MRKNFSILEEPGHYAVLNNLRFIPFILLCLSVLFFSGPFVQEAHAYVEPGSGSYFFQIIIAALVGSLFAIKQSWAKIKLFLKKLFRKKQSE